MTVVVVVTTRKTGTTATIVIINKIDKGAIKIISTIIRIKVTINRIIKGKISKEISNNRIVTIDSNRINNGPTITMAKVEIMAVDLTVISKAVVVVVLALAEAVAVAVVAEVEALAAEVAIGAR